MHIYFLLPLVMSSFNLLGMVLPNPDQSCNDHYSLERLNHNADQPSNYQPFQQTNSFDFPGEPLHIGFDDTQNLVVDYFDFSHWHTHVISLPNKSSEVRNSTTYTHINSSYRAKPGIDAYKWHYATIIQSATGNTNGTIIIRNPQENEVLQTTFKAHEERIVALDWHPTKNLLVSGTATEIKIWNITPYFRTLKIPLISHIKDNISSLVALNWNPVHYKELMIATREWVKIINYKKSIVLQHVGCPAEPVSCAALDQTGNKLAIGAQRKIYLYEKVNTRAKL